MKNIDKILSDYEELYLQLRDLISQIENLKNDVIPQEIKEKLESIDSEFAFQIGELREKLSVLEKELREAVLERKSSLTGNVIQVIYRKGSPKWDEKYLEKLSADYPLILGAREEPNPSVSISEIRGKNNARKGDEL